MITRSPVFISSFQKMSKINVKIFNPASIGERGKYMKYISFHSLPVVTGNVHTDYFNGTNTRNV